MGNYMFADGLVSEEMLEHIGMPKRSGRYPWGSGENPYHHGASAPGGKKKTKSEEETGQKKSKSKESEMRAERKTALKNIRTMSDNEISERINRIKQERELRALITQDVRPGRAAVKRVLSDAGSTVAKRAVTAMLSANTEKLLRRLYGDKVTKKEMAQLIRENFRVGKK